MSNISITSACNRSCVYCFARMGSSKPRHISSERFEAALAFLQRSGLSRVRLLGGEPTLHPQFNLFLDAIEARGLTLLLFSNGRMPEKVLERLMGFPQDRLTILLNVHGDDDFQSGKRRNSILGVLRRLGANIILGCNLHSPGVNPDFMLPLIREFGLIPEIRLGLAHPRIGAANRFLHPRHYRSVGARIGALAVKMQARGVRLELDCGFTPCMFDATELRLLKGLGAVPGKRCNPLPDLLPDGRLVPCYPLADVIHVDWRDDDDCTSVQDLMIKQLERYRRIGVFSDCGECPLRRENRCNGGCLAAAMMRVRHTPLSSGSFTRRASGTKRASVSGTSTEPDSHHDLQSMGNHTWAIPYIDQPLSFWRDIEKQFGTSIQEVYLPLPHIDLPSGRPSQKTEFLDAFLQNCPFPVGLLVNPVVLPQPVDPIVPLVVEQIGRWLQTTRVSSVTVANYTLALRIKETFPDLVVTASVLMDIASPQQAMLLNGVCDALVPSSRIMRDIHALESIRQAYNGAIRLIVNEGCLPGCVFRTQHFYEMAFHHRAPQSLCRELLDKAPWLRMTGAWVLPQHLHLFDHIADQFKLSGRVTLQEPIKHKRVLQAYMERASLAPNAIGGGPASVLVDIHIHEDFYRHTLECGKNCHACNQCRKYYQKAVSGQELSSEPPGMAFPDTGGR